MPIDNGDGNVQNELQNVSRSRLGFVVTSVPTMCQDKGLSPEQQRELDRVIVGYLLAVESGSAPDREELLAQYPQLANHLRSFFVAHDQRLTAKIDSGEAPTPPPAGDANTLPFEGAAKANAPSGAKVRYFGDYELIEEIARGGMGVVYQARQVSLNRIVAVKMILAGQLASDEEVQRFHTEAEAAANLDHPGIVPIYEVGEYEGQHYFSMGYIEGHSLAARVADGPLPPREAVELTKKIADAIAYAHSRGVIHRDLKPGNVLIDEGGEPRVTDFGLAKKTEEDSNLTGTGQILGTPSYMPPEQATGDLADIGPLSDVYSLGAILYCLLTGRPPFQAASVMDTLMQVLEREPLPPRQLDPHIPRDLETICLKCLRKSPSKRYSGARTLAEDLQRYLSDEPILARPVGRLERSYRWCKRKPALAAAMLLGFLVTTGAIVAPIVLAVHKDQAARELAVEQDKTLTALLKAQQAERAALRQAAVSTLDRALQMCEQEEVSRGLLWFTRGLELSQKAGATDLDETFRWNLGAWGREVHALQWMVSLPHEICGLAFHPDGEWIAAACRDKKLRLLSTHDGRLLQPPVDLGGFGGVAFSPDGKTLVAGAGAHIHVFDVQDGVKKRLSISAGGRNTCVAFHPDGKVFATGSRNRLAQIWDRATGNSVLAPLSHQGEVYGVAFTADGKRLVTTGVSWWLNVWSVADGKLTSQFRLPQFTYHLAISPADKVAIAFGGITAAQQFDVNTGEPVGPRLPHRADVRATAYSADGRMILTGSRDRTARLWDAASGKPIGPPLPHRHPVHHVAMHPHGLLMLTGTKDGTICAWKIARGILAQTIRDPVWITGTAFSADGRELYGGPARPVLRRWETATGRLIDEITEPKRTPPKVVGNFFSMALSPDGKTLYAALHKSGRIAYFDTTSWKLMRLTAASHGDEVHRLVVSPDGRFLVTGGNNWKRTKLGKAARLWNAGTGVPYATLQHEAAVMGIAVSPDSKYVLTGSHDGAIRLWDAKTGKPRSPPIKQTNQIFAVDFSPDGKLVVTAGADRFARLWDVETWKPVGSPMAMQGTILFARFLAGGRLLATAGEDFTARLWNVATCKPVGPVLHHDAVAWSISVSRDGKFIATGSRDNTAKIWRVPVAVTTPLEATRHWVRATTAMDMDQDGNVHVLTADAWQRELAGDR